MTQYNEQAVNFLTKANATIKIELVGCDIPTHWKGEDKKHNHYKFTITTPKGEMTDDFWDSVYNTEKFVTFDEYCVKKYEMCSNDLHGSVKITAYNEWKQQIADATPTEYDILACLEYYIPDTFDDFCAEFGYDNDSISALKTYLMCQDQASKLHKIFTEEQLEELSQIS